MGLENKKLLGLAGRYLILIATAVPNLWIFYLVFTPLTVYSSFFIIKIFFNSSTLLEGSRIVYERFYIDLVPACIAGSAYFFIFILNMTLPNIPPLKRLKMISFAFSSLLVFNILRIVAMTFLVFNKYEFAEEVHIFFWYFTSTIFLLIIWFAETRIFKIRKIPLYSDYKLLLDIRRKK